MPGARLYRTAEDCKGETASPTGCTAAEPVAQISRVRPLIHLNRDGGRFFGMALRHPDEGNFLGPAGSGAAIGDESNFNITLAIVGNDGVGSDALGKSDPREIQCPLQNRSPVESVPGCPPSRRVPDSRGSSSASSTKRGRSVTTRAARSRDGRMLAFSIAARDLNGSPGGKFRAFSEHLHGCVYARGLGVSGMQLNLGLVSLGGTTAASAVTPWGKRLPIVQRGHRIRIGAPQ